MATTFNGWAIENANFVIEDIDHRGAPQTDLSIFSMADSDKSALADVDYPSKKIRITGKIICDDTYELGAYIDIFKSYLTGQEKNLDIDWNGSTRRYIATANDVRINRTISKRHADFRVDFICTEPMGVDTATTSFSTASGVTTASATYSEAVNGTAPYQYPIITITINSLTAGDDWIKVSNNSNGQEILVYQPTFAVNDVLVIDSFERTVKINDVETDYLGAFIEWTLGEQSITYSDGFTARNVDIDIDYYKRYL